jgi:hypothetical protein
LFVDILSITGWADKCKSGYLIMGQFGHFLIVS